MTRDTLLMTMPVLETMFRLEWIISYVCQGYEWLMSLLFDLHAFLCSLASEFDGERYEAKCPGFNQINRTLCNL